MTHSRLQATQPFKDIENYGLGQGPNVVMGLAQQCRLLQGKV
jgi:hypothetical protein